MLNSSLNRSKSSAAASNDSSFFGVHPRCRSEPAARSRHPLRNSHRSYECFFARGAIRLYRQLCRVRGKTEGCALSDSPNLNRQPFWAAGPAASFLYPSALGCMAASQPGIETVSLRVKNEDLLCAVETTHRYCTVCTHTTPTGAPHGLA